MKTKGKLIAADIAECALFIVLMVAAAFLAKAVAPIVRKRTNKTV